MFQFPTPLTPTTGRAGIAGVSGGGSGAGGKGAIDLPDFMTFALSGVAPAAPGKTRQDPAGGGEAVPGGAAITPPAGHPEAIGEAGLMPQELLTAPVGNTVVAGADKSAVTVAPALPASKAKGGKQAQADKAQEWLSPKGDVAAIAPKRAASVPDASPSVVGKRTKVQREDAGSDALEVSSQPVAVASVMQPQPLVMPFTSQSVVADDRSPVPEVGISSPQSAANAETITGTTAKMAALPTFAKPKDFPVQAASESTTPAIADVPPPVKVAASADLDLARSHPTLDGDTPIASAALPRMPAVAPVSAPALAPSLVPIARMLDASYRDTPGAVVPSAPQGATAAASPVTVLSAMPASVASFLASVGPRPVAVPLADTGPKTSVRTGQVAAPAAAALAPSTPGMPTNAGPAGQLFAEAIHAAAGRGERSTQGDPASAAAFATPTTNAPATTTSTVSDRAPIDMTQGHWPAKMIERIESLRDAADAQDTRIRLIPDALGAIDVSMKRDGDTIRVHLAADRPETRVLIAEAQPRLAELGEQRGLKIAASSGQTSGQAMPQDSHQQRGNPAPPQNARPASARAGDQPVTNDDDDQRVA